MSHVERQPIQLLPYQVPHYNKLRETATNNHVYVDVSSMGLGKTHILLAIVTSFGMPFVVVGPPTAQMVWDNAVRTYETSHYLGYIGYQALRGTARYGIKHTYLTRRDVMVNGILKPIFTPTDTWLQLCAGGVFIVFDECHHLKNDSEQGQAAIALTGAVVQSSNSRIALLSATMLDKPKHVYNYLLLMSYVTSPSPFHYDRSAKVYTPTGIRELVNLCKIYDPTTTESIVPDMNTVNPKKADEKCADLFFGVIYPRLVSAMVNHKIDRRCFRGFFDVQSPEGAAKVAEGISLLSSAAGFVQTGAKETRISNTPDYSKIGRALTMIELGLVEEFIGLAAGWLDETPSDRVLREGGQLNKAILSFNHLEPVHIAEAALKRYGVVVITGEDTSMVSRGEKVDLFNNSDNVRVMIMTTATAGQSISLQDKRGDRPRRMWISPNYNMSNIHQATGRVFREGQMSVADVFLFYPKVGNMMSAILNSLSRKGDMMKRTLTAENDDTIFPGRYPRFIEGFGYVNEDAIPPESEYYMSTDAIISDLTNGTGNIRDYMLV